MNANVASDILKALERTVEHEILAGRRHAAIAPSIAAEFIAVAKSGPRHRAAPQNEAVFENAAPAADSYAPPSASERLEDCKACPCRSETTEPAIGAGNKNAPDYFFVCDCPASGADSCGDILTQSDFDLLEKMLVAMGTNSSAVYITAAIKCRPPDKPSADKAAPCAEWLRKQVAEIKPKCVIAMGDYALRILASQPALTAKNEHGKLRMFEGIPLVPTYAPAYLNKFPSVKKDAWKDLKIAMTQVKP